MKFRPLHDRVVVKPTEQENKTAGGIIIPDTAKEKPQQGEIIADFFKNWEKLRQACCGPNEELMYLSHDHYGERYLPI